MKKFTVVSRQSSVISRQPIIPLFHYSIILLFYCSIVLLFFCQLLLPTSVFAQQENKFNISFSGFIKSTVFYDSRQTISEKGGLFFLYPAPVVLSNDSTDNDINAHPSLNMLCLQSQLRANITGAEVFKAKTSGFIEGEFISNLEAQLNSFRMNHAYIKLNWKRTDLLFGQTWHALIDTNCSPATISYNTGAPFHPYSRNPQIRVTYSRWNAKVTMAAIAQSDFVSQGPYGESSEYLKNSVIPDMCIQIQYNLLNKDKLSEFLLGGGAEYKILTPRLVTDSLYKATQTIVSMAFNGFLKCKLPMFTLKLGGIFGQNLYDLMLLGGYAIKYDILSENLSKDYRNYTTLDSYSAWADFHTNGKNFQGGVFVGYTQNYSSLKNIQNWTYLDSYYSRGYLDSDNPSDGIIDYGIAYIYRISPRVIANIENIGLSSEIEYTVASYGKKINSLGEVSDTEEIGNIRFLFTIAYLF